MGLTFDRRSFLACAAALPAAGSLAAVPVVQRRQPAGAAPALRGLIPAEDLLIEPGLTYLQTGSVGPSPRPVFDRTVSVWRELEGNPTWYGYRIDPPILEEVRSKAAAFLGCAHDELILTRGTTDGMNAVACGLNLSPGDRVLTTDQEHGGGRLCWDYLAANRGVVVDEVPIPLGESDVEAILNRFRTGIRPETRVVSFSHVLYSTGLRMPARELCGLAREHGCLSVVDGAQAAGGMRVDVTDIGCDVYVTTGHKWMLGPKGTGMLVLREPARDRVRLIAEMASRAVQSDSTGLVNVPGFIGLGAAVDYVSALGIDRVEAHNLSLRDTAFKMLGELSSLRVLSPGAGPLASPLITAKLPDGVNPAELVPRLLQEHRVLVRPLPAISAVRLSTHVFNSHEDVERGVAALRATLA